jgi:hypothetical protein
MLAAGMIIVTSAEHDYQAVLDILADMPENAISVGARAALDEAQRATRLPAAAVRIIAFRVAEDRDSLRTTLEGVLTQGKPRGTRKYALQRVLPQLTAAR